MIEQLQFLPSLSLILFFFTMEDLQHIKRGLTSIMNSPVPITRLHYLAHDKSSSSTPSSVHLLPMSVILAPISCILLSRKYIRNGSASFQTFYHHVVRTSLTSCLDFCFQLIFASILAFNSYYKMKDSYRRLPGTNVDIRNYYKANTVTTQNGKLNFVGYPNVAHLYPTLFVYLKIQFKQEKQYKCLIPFINVRNINSVVRSVCFV